MTKMQRPSNYRNTIPEASAHALATGGEASAFETLRALIIADHEHGQSLVRSRRAKDAWKRAQEQKQNA